MTPAERAKHALKNDWQEAYIEEKTRALVKALNRPALGMRTIAACEGHAYPIFTLGSDGVVRRA